ncbi:hypothetical protein A28LD_0811 [Idiomarina sp. A28L]|uniref:hypothetical protein n=1 Tax=Idiomarina sp. A28L TaxID=1036674 RepID=UPI00021388FF|nr:hypothetical protein [Idiomarina sp. A28L]EGN75764.1 hypothetical protein A28LD_0811 [Idiomarina sp. A28L]
MSTYTALSFTALPIIKSSGSKPTVKSFTENKLSWNENSLHALIDFSSQRPLQMSEAVELEHAEELMDASNARYACVLNRGGELVGILPKQEFHGRLAINKARDLRIPHGQLTIDYIMIPIAKLPLVSRQQLQHAKIGDVVATLHRSGQDYLLVHEEGEIIGVVPALRIVELTGESVQIRHHANSFAEIMNAVRHRDAIE